MKTKNSDTKTVIRPRRINKAAVGRLDFSVMKNFFRYGDVTRKAIVAGIAGKAGKVVSKGSEVGFSYDPDNPHGVWIHIGGGKYIFVRFYRPLRPLPPDPHIRAERVTAEIHRALEGNVTFERTISNPRCCDITVKQDGKNVLNMLVVDTLPIM